MVVVVGVVSAVVIASIVDKLTCKLGSWISRDQTRVISDGLDQMNKASSAVPQTIRLSCLFVFTCANHFCLQTNSSFFRNRT